MESAVCINTYISKKNEQGIDEETLVKEYTFTWELKMVFDRELKNMKSATCAITEFNVDENSGGIKHLTVCTVQWLELTVFL